ncbi:ATP phosphoribosyltransferase regulatory subunit [Marinibactrum halimedae]|uniref:ATP phosphoribosyltransferase regulatory subunit n=1 Tax=Marinibactrum halimedae TaxID=1444977 RepID=A0AA37T0I8_9GAMM|nr:ATP phosphoribosyltransferase regulatory subunit [Marinibactrum halimedae]MCD9459718.1 ATP phosphoribosyltransferase regulatory subunit [Marinibactrum halimedae]GLS24525.1 ATP phosphoribosyltransferase regulatory subunit [Marinibactrum halimedae]
MSYADRWLLPDGVDEILPAAAEQIESLRRQLVDLYHRWGYDLVIPPMIEYTDSLLVGLGSDIDLLTFRLTDQLSGRMMGLRADMTPQIARMDAHSFRREGISRLCYTGHVIHAKPKNPLASRTPIQAGIELYGEAGIEADIEVVSLLLESLQTAGLPSLNIDLGHVGIFRALSESVSFSTEQERQLFDLLQQKSTKDIDAWVEANVTDTESAKWFFALAGLAGDASVLQRARDVFDQAPAEVIAAIDELEVMASVISQRYPQAKLYFDLSELRGYHYHTGVVFAAFSPGHGEAIANGGRYDHIGEVFGHARPATGFSIALTTLHQLLSVEYQPKPAIFAASTEDPKQWLAIQALRSQGERVVCGLADQALVISESLCDRQLVLEEGEYCVKPLNKN